MKIKKILSGLVAGALAMSTLAGVSSFSASADSDPETPVIPALNGLVKCQLRKSAEGTGKDVRFLAVVKESDVLYGASAEWTIEAATADAPDDFQEVEIQELTDKAYKSVIANGVKVNANDVAKEIWNWSADTEYCFILSQPVGSFDDGDKVLGSIWVLNFSTSLDREVTIGAATPSSKPDSSSEVEESSSEVEESSSTSEQPSGEGVIWEGSEDLGAWKNDVELGVAGIPNAKENGILTIEYEATGAAQIQIINKLGEDFTWTPMETADGAEYFDTTGGKLQIKLTAKQAAELAESKGIFLKGTGAVVTKMVYTEPGADAGKTEVIWEGEEDLNAWKKDVNLGVTGIPTAEEGGILTVEYTGTGAAQIQIINKLGADWAWTPMQTADGNEYFDTTGGKLQIKLTAQQAAELAAGKEMHVKGTGAVITKITYTTPGGNAGQTEVIWTGEEDLGAWKNDVELGVAGIPMAEENGILTIKYTSTGDAQIQVINKLGDAWTWTPMETADGEEYFDTTGGELQIKLTAAQAAALASSKAIYLKGQNAVVTEITYTTPGSKPSDSSSEAEESSTVVEDSSTVVEDSSSTSEQPSTEEVLWEGEEDLGAWKNDVELGVAGIPTAVENGILTIEYTATGAAQIQVINKIGADFTWTPMETADGAEYFDTTGGKLKIKLTAAQAEALASSKAIFLKGTGAVVTKLTYTAPGGDAGKTEVIWEGEEDLNAWKTDVNLGVAGIPLAEEGGILAIEYTGTGAAQIQVINKIGADWAWTPMQTADGNEYFDATGGKLQIKLTAAQAAELAAGKEMHIKGTGAVITKITYTAPGGNAGTVETIWEGEEDLNAWKADVNLGVAGIPLAEEGGILTVEYTGTGAAQIQIINKLGADWAWTPMLTAEGDDFFDTTGGKLQIKLTAQQAAELAAGKEMHIKGTGAVITKLTYTSK